MKTCVVCGMEKEHPNHDSMNFGKYAHDFKTYKPSFKAHQPRPVKAEGKKGD